MSFTARLSTDLISVEAGATVPLSVEVVNRGEEADRFELDVEGLDPEWTAVPVPTFPVGPGETATEKIFFRTPRNPESQSGNYPFTAKVRSLTSGEQRTVQGLLEVLPYHHISAEISPKKGVVASFKRRNHFTVTLMNLSNVEHTLQLFGSDSDEALAYDFDQEKVTLGPGQQKDVGLTVHPTQRKLLWNVELHAFSVSARSVEIPSVAAVAQAQLEAQPAVKASTLILWLFIAAIAGTWIYAQPKPPTFVMGLSQKSVKQHDDVSIWWQVTNADRVHIDADGQPIYDNVVTENKGSIPFTANADKPVHITGYAIGKDDKRTQERNLILDIVVPPPAPPAKIISFSASSPRVKVGDSVVLSYKLNDAVKKATLFPMDKDISVNANQIQIPITDEGAKDFTLIAYNADGKPDQKTVHVTGYVESDVKVISFTGTPKDLMDPGGIVKISWQLTNAVHAEITPNPNIDSNEVDPNKGEFEYFIRNSTTFTLTAKDKNGLAIPPQTVRIIVEPPANPTPTTGGISASPPLADVQGPR